MLNCAVILSRLDEFRLPRPVYGIRALNTTGKTRVDKTSGNENDGRRARYNRKRNFISLKITRGKKKSTNN